ncbi:MAG: ATP-binding protein [Actinobacteria bacterium]|nr:ATP-binding protein [Actinomycetota bacterium]
MTPRIPVGEYARFLRSEYLESFVASGGSAVKVAVVPDAATADALAQAVRADADSLGYATVAVDSAFTRVNLIQQIFFAAAGGLDWAAHARTVVESLVEEVYGPEARNTRTLDDVAETTGIDRTLVRTRMDEALTKRVIRNYTLAKDFRLAMVQLCLSEFQPELYTEAGCSAILEWLRGELRLISALKDRLIFQKITRHNARPMLASTARWLHQAGLPGLLIVLDARQLAVARPAAGDEGSLHYTPAALMDAYEVLRQFIDATDEMEHLMLLVVAPSDLLDEDNKRGIASYHALRNRIWDDVRDRERANPCAPMVHVVSDEGSD